MAHLEGELPKVGTAIRAVWDILGSSPKAPKEIANALDTDSPTLHQRVGILRRQYRLPVWFSSVHRGYWKGTGLVTLPPSSSGPGPRDFWCKEPGGADLPVSSGFRVPREGSRARAVWDTINEVPQSATEIARRIGCTEAQARRSVEGCRQTGLPIWFSANAEGFWTDLDYHSTPARGNAKSSGFGGGWQREPPNSKCSK